MLIDRERVGLFTVKPPGADKNDEAVDAHLKLRVTVKAGPHDRRRHVPQESLVAARDRAPAVRRALQHAPASAHGAGPLPGLHHRPVRRHGPRRHAQPPPDLRQRERPGGDRVARRAGGAGAADPRPAGAPGLSASRHRRGSAQAAAVLPRRQRRQGRLRGRDRERAQRHSRQPAFSHSVSKRIPQDLAPGTVHRVSDLELASRLSFFLWSSIPDDALLEAAVRGDLRQPQPPGTTGPPHARGRALAQPRHQLRQPVAPAPQARIDHARCCACSRTSTTTSVRPSGRKPSSSSRASCAKTAASPTCVRADYTFVNERLAKHYGIPHIYGSHFRRVSFAGDPERQRGGLLRHGSILTVTSYATRTSPVIRGHWILVNILGEPPPPPPPNVPALDENTVSAIAAHARAPGRPPRQSLVRELPQRHGSRRFRAGELRRRRPLARRGGSQADRRVGRAARRQHVRGRGGAGARSAAAARTLRWHGRPKSS